MKVKMKQLADSALKMTETLHTFTLRKYEPKSRIDIKTVNATYPLRKLKMLRGKF
jgi:hypothetical protein